MRNTLNPEARLKLKRSKIFLRLLPVTGFRYAYRSISHELGPCESDEKHLHEAMRWLCRAEDVTKGKGVSKQYRIFEGWDPNPYPETTGYILETFLRYWKVTGDREYLDRAMRMGLWEIDCQHPSGGIASSIAEPEILRGFNTGQVIHGWCSLAVDTRSDIYLAAAIRAADYLLGIQAPDGAWEKDSYCGGRTYDSRVAWALLRLAQLTKTKKYAESAHKNLSWVLDQQQNNGWWRQCGFFARDPITHLIAYTMEGLLESHLLLKEDSELAAGFSADKVEKLAKSVFLAADALCTQITKNPALGIRGLPHGSYGMDWTSQDDHSCLTGNAQIAIVLYRIDQKFGRTAYREVADTIVETSKRMQDISSGRSGIRGGIAGPFPIYKGYDPYHFLNWATKFFADMLLVRQEKST